MATLTITHTEDLTLNGVQQGTTNTQTLSSIGSVYKRIVKIKDDTDATILVFKDSVTDGNKDTAQSAGGCFKAADTKYFRITNLDSDHPCHLNIIGDVDRAGDAAADDGVEAADDGLAVVLLKPGYSFIWGEVTDSFNAHDAQISVLATVNNISRIFVNSLSEDVDVEIFVAGT